MINPRYLWQVGLISDGTATVTGVAVDSNGVTWRVTLTVGTTAHNAKYFLQNASQGDRWFDGSRELVILSVSGANLYVNCGSLSAQDGDWVEAPTTANEMISAGSYVSAPVSIMAVAA